MRVLIIGNGFIAKHLINALSMSDHEVFVYQRDSFLHLQHVITYLGEIQDQQALSHAIQKIQPQIIFHLAAYKERSQDLLSIEKALTVNLLGTSNLLVACTQIKSLKLLVVMGTIEEYGDTSEVPFKERQRERPISNYSLSKLCQTQLCEMFYRVHQLPILILRPSIIYGPGQSQDMFVAALIQSLVNNIIFPMTQGEQKRDFVYIQDFINLLVGLIEKPRGFGQIVNIGFGLSYTLKYVAEFVARAMQRVPLLHFGAINYRQGEIFDYLVDIDKAKHTLGWSPTISLEQGLLETIAHYQQEKDCA